MAATPTVFKRKLDLAPSATVDVVALNNKIVLMRAVVKRAKLYLINKMSKKIQALKKKKGNEKQKVSNKAKADRLLEEIKLIKMMKADYVAKYSLGSTDRLKDIVCKPSSSREVIALAKLVEQKFIQDVVKDFRDKHEDWRDLVAYLMTKHTSREFKKKKKAEKMAKVENTMKEYENLVQTYLEDKLKTSGEESGRDEEKESDSDMIEDEEEESGNDTDEAESDLESESENKLVSVGEQTVEQSDKAETATKKGKSKKDLKIAEINIDVQTGKGKKDVKTGKIKKKTQIGKMKREVEIVKNKTEIADSDNDNSSEESSFTASVRSGHMEELDESEIESHSEDEEYNQNYSTISGDNSEDDGSNFCEEKVIKNVKKSTNKHKVAINIKSSVTDSDKLKMNKEKNVPKKVVEMKIVKDSKAKLAKLAKDKTSKVFTKTEVRPVIREKTEGEIVVKKLNLNEFGNIGESSNKVPDILLDNNTTVIKPKKKVKDSFFDNDNDDDNQDIVESGNELDQDNEDTGFDNDNSDQALENVEGRFRNIANSKADIYQGKKAFSTTFLGSLSSHEMMKCKGAEFRTNADWKKIRHDTKARGGMADRESTGSFRGNFSSRGGSERGNFRGGSERGNFRGGSERGNFRGGHSDRGGAGRGESFFGRGRGVDRGRGGDRGRGRGGDRGRGFRDNSSFRGRGSGERGGPKNFSGGRSEGRGGKTGDSSSAKLHPSWEASRKRHQVTIQPFTGKKVKFDD